MPGASQRSVLGGSTSRHCSAEAPTAFGPPCAHQCLCASAQTRWQPARGAASHARPLQRQPQHKNQQSSRLRANTQARLSAVHPGAAALGTAAAAPCACIKAAHGSAHEQGLQQENARLSEIYAETFKAMELLDTLYELARAEAAEGKPATPGSYQAMRAAARACFAQLGRESHAIHARLRERLLVPSALL